MKFKELTDANVQTVVPKNATGVYFLATNVNGVILLKYIGRSDTRLRERLLDHAKDGKYHYFSFQITDTIFDAYRLECREWHNAIELDNKVHPKKPKNLKYKCPYCEKKEGGYTQCQMKRKSRK